jgi:hypothetical protein
MLELAVSSDSAIFVGHDFRGREYVAAVPLSLALLGLKLIYRTAPVRMSHDECRELQTQIRKSCGEQTQRKGALKKWMPILRGQLTTSGGKQK